MSPCNIIVYALISTIFVFCAHAQTPTTPYFPEVFKGKCFDKNPVGIDCYGLYDTFSEAAMTDNSIVNATSYEPFFNLANFSTPENSILFWSGSMAFALAISSNDPRFVTVEETATGYILNSLSWCGTSNHSWNYNSPCYYPSNSTYYGMSGVWTRASQMFAHGASGDVFILLQPGFVAGNPPTYQAYRPSSIFGSTELPTMDPARVKSITVLLLRNTELAPGEACGKGSLANLTDVVKAKFNFTPTCVDDPSAIYSILCPRNSTVSAQCLAATLVYNYEVAKQQKMDYYSWAVAATCVGVILLITNLIFLMRCLTVRKGYDPIEMPRPPSKRV